MRGGIAVVGAGGFVGARLVEMAVGAGRDDVIPIVRAVRSVGRFAHLGVAYRIGDAGRPDSLARSLDGCDVVVNLTKGEPADILRVTQNVYAAAVAAGARRLIHLSSAAVYGQVERPDLPDDAPPWLRHWMPYARQKGLAENFLRERMTDHRLDIVVLRPTLIWGPASPYVLESAIALGEGTAYLIGDGNGICDLLYVDNLARGILAVAAHSAAASGFYNVADDETTTWREYYAALAAGLGIDIATVHRIAGASYRGGIGDLVAGVRDLGAYRWLKGRVPVETRAAIKLRIRRSSARGAASMTGTRRPAVTREMWQLQTTRYRLPTGKFRTTFGPTNQMSFETGMAASLAWLGFIGIGAAAA